MFNLSEAVVIDNRLRSFFPKLQLKGIVQRDVRGVESRLK
jgi:hypothetical protein